MELAQRGGVIFEQDADAVARPDGALAQDVAEYEQMVRESVSAGQLLTAIEVARDGLTRFGASRQLQQQLALALAQTGAVAAAHELLGELARRPTPDEETLGLLGRVHKEIWRRAPRPEDAVAALREASRHYGDAFARYDSYYPGINLAFTLAALGEQARAEEVARQVEKLCRRELAAGRKPVDGWVLGTLAEALVHQGDTVEAAKFYRQAAEVFRGRWRDLASMRRQAREILRLKRERTAAGGTGGLATLRQRAREFFGRAQPGEEWLDPCFDFPSVVVFAGHMVDRPDRPMPRFPASAAAAAREEIRLQLLNRKAGFGYSSAAAGADLIFCECLLEMEAKVNLVLPCPVDAFKRQSVSYAGPDWERRFHHVLAHATSCVIANPLGYALPGVPAHAASPMGLLYSSRIAAGLAALQAQALDLDLHAMALWNGAAGDGPGGTADLVAEWQRRGLQPIVIAPEAGGAPAPAGAPAAPVPATTAAPQVIKALLFVEVVNFHKVGETQMPAFVAEFKGAMARLMTEMKCEAAIAESWNAAHYFAYDELEPAALLALALRDLVAETRWAERGLPADLGVRIVLHAGPVFTFEDPALRRMTCMGAHVNRAARIWPITPTGQVYATQGFAALCGAESVASVSFEYLGYLRTTTMFEDAPLFRMDRRN